ncbi:unnamed protein product [Brassica rapa subsp. narinosa]
MPVFSAILLLIVTGHSSRVESTRITTVDRRARENLDDFTFLDFPALETYGMEHQEIQEILGGLCSVRGEWGCNQEA